MIDDDERADLLHRFDTCSFDSWIEELGESVNAITNGRTGRQHRHWEMIHVSSRLGRSDEVMRMIPGMIDAVDRATRGCKICHRLPSVARRLTNHEVIGRICMECSQDLRRHLHDLIDERDDELRRQHEERIEQQRKAREEKLQRDCAVYVIRWKDRDAIKVGMSVDPPARMRSLEKEVNAELDLVHSRWFGNVERARLAEKMCHSRLSAHRVVDVGIGVEWFGTTPADAIAIVEAVIPPR